MKTKLALFFVTMLGGLARLSAAAIEAAAPPAAAPYVDSAALERIGRYLDEVERAGEHGALLVANREGIAFRRGFGHATDGRAITPDTAFDIGSITKPFTAAAILLLQADGKLSPDDPIEKFFPQAPADKRKITLDQLLTHSAGFPQAFGGDYEALGREDFLRRAFDTPLAVAPGSRYLYSNVGYSILAAILETITNDSFEKFLAQRIFEPAEMTSTGYLRVPVDRLARGYSEEGAGKTPRERPWDSDGPYWNLRGNGGLISTVGDLYRFDRALAIGRLLPPQLVESYQRGRINEGEGAPSQYAYGWAILPTRRGTQLVTHNGSNGTFFADFLRYPHEGVVIAFATNRSTPTSLLVAQEVARIVFDSTYRPTLPHATTATHGQEIPAGPRGEVVRRLLETLRTPNEESVRALVENHFDAPFAAMAPLAAHREQLGRVGAKLAAGTLLKVSVLGDRWELVHQLGDTPKRLTLVVEFAPDTTNSLAGLHIESD